MRTKHADVLKTLASGQLTDEAIETIKSTMADVTAQYQAS